MSLGTIEKNYEVEIIVQTWYM